MDGKQHYVNLEYVEKFDRTRGQKASAAAPQPEEGVGLEEGDEVIENDDNVPEAGAKIRV